jgi:hypothetical protein
MRIVVAVILVMVMLSLGLASEPNAQDASSDQEIANLVAQLSWTSIRGECRGLIWRFYPDSEAALKLIKIGKPATDELLKVLGDEDRGVVAHIILTQIWEPGDYFGESSKGDPSKLKTYVVTYTYNDLKWTWTKKKGYKADRTELAANADKWRKKIARFTGTAKPGAAPNNGMHPTR